MLAQNGTLERLDLADNALGDAAAIALSSALRQVRSRLACLLLKIACLLTSPVALRQNDTLLKLRLVNNPICASGLRALLSFWRSDEGAEERALAASRSTADAVVEQPLRRPRLELQLPTGQLSLKHGHDEYRYRGHSFPCLSLLPTNVRPRLILSSF